MNCKCEDKNTNYHLLICCKETENGYTEEDIKNMLTDMFEKAIPNKDELMRLIAIIADRYI